MKHVMLTACGLVTFFFLLPMIFVQGALPAAARNAESDPPPAVTPTPMPQERLDAQTTLTVLQKDGSVITTTMDKYLPGVVAAEMPAAFEEEALQAQAIAARTYACARCASPNPNHPEADLCTDYACCQAWRDDEELNQAWGENADAYRQKIESAVSSTDGQVILYDGSPIRAVFFSSASGRTNDAVEVWGSAVPYLTGVETPEGDEVPNFHSTHTVTAADFKAAFLAQHADADLSGDPSGWFGAPEYTSSGAVAAIPVGGVRVTGPELRTLLGLRSANFSVAVNGESITFSVTGYGHGVGMSQYGANALAKEGRTCEEILTHYYTGVTIAPYPDL